MAITVAMRTQVSQLYVSLFGRAPDGEGLGFWVNKLDSGQTMAQVAQQMYDVPAARTYYKSYATNEEIVATFYQNVLGRAVGNDTEGQAFWVAKMNKPGATKGDVFAELVSTVVNYAGTDPNGVTSKALFNNRVSVAQFYGEQNGSIDGATNALVGVTSDAATVVTAKSAAATSASSTSGGTFTLTTGSDVLNLTTVTAANKTTAGDDIIYANTDGFLTSADIIDAGAGNDTILASATAAAQTLAPILTSVETVTITATPINQKTLTFDAANTTGLTTLNIKNAGAISGGAAGEAETIILSNLAKTTTIGIVGGTAITGTLGTGDMTGSAITPTFTGAAAADTQKININTKGIVGYLTLATAETVEITATGTGTTGANTIGILDAQAVKTLNIKGTGDLTISASDLAAAPTIDASTTTGVIKFTGETAATTTTFTGGSGATTVSTASTGIVKVTTFAGADVVDFLTAANTATVSTGAGNDEVRVGAQSQVTSADSIDGGDGIDTITISDATINGTTKTALAAGTKNFEIVRTTNVAEVAIDFNALSSWDIVQVSVASTATAAASTTSGVAGIAAVAATMENPDVLHILANRTGQVGSKITGTAGVDVGGTGGDALTITPRTDTGSNAATVKLIGNVTLTGGAGAASSAPAAADADAGGVGGIAFNAPSIEVINLDISGTNATGVAADTVTFTGGAAGAAAAGGVSVAGTAGSTMVVGTNATINITSSLTGSTAVVNNNLTLGTVVGTNVTINASTFAGKLSVTAASGNVTITGGTAADTLTGGAGVDTISGGAGADVITGGAGADILSGGAGRDVFNIATAAHSSSTAADKISDFGKSTVALTAAQNAAMTDRAGFQATATGLSGAESDMLDMATTATLAAAATGTDVSAAVTTNPVVTGTISAKGIVTVAGAGASLVDTLAEWVAVALIMTAQNNVAAFEFNGNTYVVQEGVNAAGSDVVELTGVTGVTGIALVGASTATTVGDIFVI